MMDAALEGALAARGATIGQALGVRVPLCFSELDHEWQAARSSCAVWLAGFRTLIAATGDDRVSFLQGMLSNDVKALAPGDGVRAAFLTQQGKMVADLRVYADTDRMLLDVFTQRAEALAAALSRFIVADDIELATTDSDVPLCGFSGPLAPTVLERLLDRPLAPWRALHHEHYRCASASVRVVAASEIGDQGYLVCGAAENAAALFEAACTAGAVPVGMNALDVLRIEAGVPWYGVDVDEDILVVEAGLEQALSFTKGCYLGQEVVERVTARGHVNKKLSGLLVDGDRIPVPGTTLEAGGREVGRITSAARSPALHRVIALGYVHRDYLTPGTPLSVAGDDVKATVTSLPLV